MKRYAITFKDMNNPEQPETTLDATGADWVAAYAQFIEYANDRLAQGHREALVPIRVRDRDAVLKTINF